MYQDSDKRSPTGGDLWVYEMEFNEEDQEYFLDDPNWSMIEYEESYTVNGRKAYQRFSGKSALERKLEGTKFWDYDGVEKDMTVYSNQIGWEVRYSDDRIEVDIGGTELSNIREYDLEAWLHCKESDSIERLVDEELNNNL